VVIDRNVSGKHEFKLWTAGGSFRHQWDWEIYLSSSGGDDSIEAVREGILRSCHGAASERKLSRYGDRTLSGRVTADTFHLASPPSSMVPTGHLSRFEPILFPKAPKKTGSPAKDKDPPVAIFFSLHRYLPVGCRYMGDQPERADGISSPLPGGPPAIQHRSSRGDLWHHVILGHGLPTLFRCPDRLDGKAETGDSRGIHRCQHVDSGHSHDR